MDAQFCKCVLRVPDCLVGTWFSGRWLVDWLDPSWLVAAFQAICFVEQLGTYWPVEAPIAGELVAFEVEEGGPVEYKQVCPPSEAGLLASCWWEAARRQLYACMLPFKRMCGPLSTLRNRKRAFTC